MIVPQKIPELLAPAGTMEALKAAVYAGADAVYLGGTAFGARAYAGNFDREKLPRAIAFCHARDVMVYVTVNTLLYEDELKRAGEYLLFLSEIGADAILVQDFGLLWLARRLVPDLPVHASTQMCLHNAESIRWAAEQGISRVVLPRELSADVIREIHDAVSDLPIELEIFLHGALCYAYSGRCLFSSFLGGRSGNRGMCAQPCRKEYQLIEGEADPYGRLTGQYGCLTGREQDELPAHLLSTRDLCLYPSLRDVAALPVATLKIEGRMKSPAYVAAVVSTYRRALDAYKVGNFEPWDDDVRILKAAFNRTFTGGYLMGDRGQAVIGQDRAGDRGLKVGTIIEYDEEDTSAIVSLTPGCSLSSGDGVVIRSSSGPDVGTTLRSVRRVGNGQIRIWFPEPVQEGDEVVLTLSSALEKEAAQCCAGALPYPRPLSVSCDLSFVENTPVLTGIYESRKGPVTVTITGDAPWQPARTRPLTTDKIRELLLQTGGTQFVVEECNIAEPGNLFAPVSMVKDLRRQLFVALEEALILSHQRVAAADEERLLSLLTSDDGTEECRPEDARLLVYVDSAEAVRSAVDAGAGSVYYEPPITFRQNGIDLSQLPPTNDVLEILEEVATICRASGVELFWVMPEIADDSFLRWSEPLVYALAKRGDVGILVDSPGAMKMVLRVAPDMRLAAGRGFQMTNHLSWGAFFGKFSRITLSQELSAEKMSPLMAMVPQDSSAAEIFVQGRTELMITEDCLLRTASGDICRYPDCHNPAVRFGIKDEKSHIFPFHMDGSCRTHIENAVELCLVDALPAFLGMGISSFALECRGRTPEYVWEMTTLYAGVLDSLVAGTFRTDLPVMKKEIGALCDGGMTRGHYQLRTGQKR